MALLVEIEKKLPTPQKFMGIGTQKEMQCKQQFVNLVEVIMKMHRCAWLMDERN